MIVIRKYRLTVLLFLFVGFFLFCKWFFSPEHIRKITISAAEAVLRKEVSIGEVRIKGLSRISCSNVTMGEKNKAPTLKFAEAKIEYDPLSLLKGRIARVMVKNPSVWLEAESSEIRQAPETKNVNKAQKFFFRPLEIIVTNANVTKNNAIPLRVINANVEALDMTGIGDASGTVYYVRLEVESAGYGKVNVRDIKAQVIAKDDSIVVKKCFLAAYGGIAQGRGEMKFTRNAPYRFRADIDKLNLEQICKYVFPSKYRVTGAVNGYISISGEKAHLQNMEGEFGSVGSGGTINAETFKLLLLQMQDGALKSAISAICSENEDFIYEEGTMKIGLRDNGDVLINLFLKSPKGKFSFDINMESAVVHSFLSGKYYKEI